MGNFSSVINISNGTSTTQTRTHNAQNELVTISGTAATPTYDANGNLTKDETGALLTYDAWNRLVKVAKGSANVTYSYDAVGRRITESLNGVTKDLYYSNAWQVLEERTGGAAKTQYVWSPVYVDAMIERDRDANNSIAGLEERIWSLQDANFNTTALVTSTGTERFLYDPYGRLTDVSGNAAAPAAANDWIYLHQGGRLDANTALYNFRNRDYSTTLMRWTTNDPLGFGGGDTNTYRYVGNGPTVKVDPLGLEAAVGHHYIPAGVVTDAEIEPHLSKAAIERSAGYVSGPTWPRHSYDTYGGVKHSDYNKMVKSEMIEYMKKRGIVKEGRGGKLVNVRKMRPGEMVEFMTNIHHGKNLSNKNTEKLLRSFNSAVDDEAKAHIKKFGRGINSNLDEAGQIKLGKRYVANSGRYALLGALTGAASFAGKGYSFAEGLSGLSEGENPFSRALMAADRGDFAAFEKALIGDGQYAADEQHLYGFLTSRMGVPRYAIDLSFQAYCDAMRALVNRARESSRRISELVDDNPRQSSDPLYDFRRGFCFAVDGKYDDAQPVDNPVLFTIGVAAGVLGSIKQEK